MAKPKRKSNMLVPTVVMAVLAITLLAIGYFKGGGEHLTGLKTAVGMTWQIIPLLVFAFIVAGMVQVLIPRELLNQWVGAESGFRGIIVGSIAGGLSPGGPYVSLPIAAGFLQAGAGVGTMVAYLTGWSLYAVGRLPMEVGILGWKLTVARLLSTLIFPPLAGLIANAFFSGFK
jgi:uncharacterized membrane protein YraQ (UPF0718 family)